MRLLLGKGRNHRMRGVRWSESGGWLLGPGKRGRREGCRMGLLLVGAVLRGS